MKKSSNQGNQLAGKLWVATVGLSLAAVGALFIWYLWAVYQKAGKMDHWVETPCLLEKSAMDDSELTQRYATKYTYISEYRYQYQGRSYLGKQYKRLQPASGDKRKITKLLKANPAGSQMICYVDPDEPENAVLVKDSKASIYSIWFPALFLVGGLVMAISVFRTGQK